MKSVAAIPAYNGEATIGSVVLSAKKDVYGVYWSISASKIEKFDFNLSS